MLKIKNILSTRNKAILNQMVVTDFKVRYQGSILGYAWSVLKPLFMFVILYIVFVKFLRILLGIRAEILTQLADCACVCIG
jgi:ABC-type polysaccharide/polyol phosphate export permease